jgi:hypothetical protein
MSEPEDRDVATGDRREDMHFEPDPDQLVRARFTHKPPRLPPEQEQTMATDRGDIEFTAPPVEDVAVAAPGPSAWDARPVTKAEDGEPGSS